LSDYQHPSGVVIMARAQDDLQRPLSGLISVLSVNYHPTSGICITSSSPPSTRGNEKCYYYFYRNPILTRFLNLACQAYQKPLGIQTINI